MIIACGVTESAEILVVELEDGGSLRVSVETENEVRELTLPARAVVPEIRALVSEEAAA